MQNRAEKNRACVVWSVCLLWLISLFAITVSVMLFFCVGDMLICTGTDVINSLVFLCGIVMLPTNLHLLYYIAGSRKIRSNSKTGCCPLWLAASWTILISLVGIIFCIERLVQGKPHISAKIVQSMSNYRNSLMHKRFIDNLQWSLKCCGLNSYKDWFGQDWYDKIRDYEWGETHYSNKKSVKITDSVPLSCCKSGSCVSNYLAELGTAFINTHGCGTFLHRLILMSMILHIAMFFLIILLELIVICSVKGGGCGGDDETGGARGKCKQKDVDVRQLMDVKDNFRPSSESYIDVLEESDEELSRNYDYDND